MKTRKSMLIVAMIALFALATIGVNAQEQESHPPPTPPQPPNHEMNIPPPPHPPKGNRNMQRYSMRDHTMTRQQFHSADLPGLTITQQEQIKKEKLNNMQAMTPLKNKIREKHAHLVTLLSSDDLNMKDVNKTIDEIGALNTKMLQQQVAHHHAVRGLLTPDQKILYDARPKHFLGRK